MSADETSGSTREPEMARYLAWKKNAPHLYQTLATFELEWPSHTVQWMPEVVRAPTTGKRSQSLLLGTQTTGQARDYVRMARLELPESTIDSLDRYDAEAGIIGGHIPRTAADLRITQRIDHVGGVNCVRYMPQNPNLVAAFSTTGILSVYDITHYPSSPSGTAHPDIALEGHRTEGLTLAWSSPSYGLLASGDNEGRVLVWDVTKYDHHTGKLAPEREIKHNESVTAVHWHPQHPHTLASVGDDSALKVTDTRSSETTTLLSASLSPSIPSSMAWNPSNVALLAIGFDDGAVELWDLRNTASRVEQLGRHDDAVTSLSWSHLSPKHLASSSLDTTASLWNIANLEKPQIFKHGGHTAAVTDVAWNIAVPGMLASTACNNALHVWKPLSSLLSF